MLSVYKASAGSGKTFTLTREYIKMLLGDKDPETGRYRLSREKGRHRHTLAITFTNKATEEMKRRIIHQLAVMGGVEPGWTAGSPYEKELVAEFGCTAAELRNAARSALKSLLLEFDSFHVSTIDSFFQQVLRAFAREAELTGNYELELDESSVLNQTVGELLTSLRNKANPHANRQLVDWLTRLMIDRIEGGKTFNVFNRDASVFSDVVNFVKDISGEGFNDIREEMMHYLSDQSKIASFLEQVRRKLDSLYPDVVKKFISLRTYISDHGYGGDTISVNMLKLIEKWTAPEPPEKIDIGKTVEKVALDPKAAFKAKHDPGDLYLDSLLQEACECLIDYKMYNPIFKAILKNAYMLGLLNRILDLMNQRLLSDNRLMLSDTSYILSRIIGDSDAPFVYERLGVELHHFLIDEFQDTSRLQWENLSKLLNDGLAYGYDSLIIGDEKQCIYRFRNSDPTLLQRGVKKQMSSYYHEHGTGPGDNINWRSAREVVEFNNDLFHRLAEKLGFSEDVYANVTQGIPHANAYKHGYVRVDAFGSDDDSLDNMIENIKRQIAAGYRLGQIAVLVRKAKEGEQVIRKLLSAHDDDSECPRLRVVSDDTVTVSTSPAVRLIVSVLRVMSTADKAEGEHGVTRRRFARMRQAFESMLNGGLSRTDALCELLQGFDSFMADEEDNGGDAANSGSFKFAELPKRVCANMTSVVEDIITTFVPRKAYEAENVFISTFQDMVLDFSRRGQADLVSFLRWWDARGHDAKVMLPADPDAIRVMTIHKSKGLEFECVHLPFASWPYFEPKSPEWFSLKGLPGLSMEYAPPYFPLVPDENMTNIETFRAKYNLLKSDTTLDELNVAYVAFTRAVSELIVGAVLPARKRIRYLSNDLIDELHLDDGPFIAGAPTVPPEQESKPSAALESSRAVDMPGYATYSHADLWAATKLEEDDDSLSEPRRRGKELHALLSKVTDLSRLPMAGEEANDLRRMISEHGVERWFDGFERVMCEREIVARDGNVFRPDRLVWLPNGSVEIIDYKTGEENDVRYRRQLRHYIKWLRELGFGDVRGYIWYLDTDRIVEIGYRDTKKG